MISIGLLYWLLMLAWLLAGWWFWSGLEIPRRRIFAPGLLFWLLLFLLGWRVFGWPVGH